MAGHALAAHEALGDGELGSPTRESRQALAEKQRALFHTVFQESPPPDFAGIPVPESVPPRYDLKDPITVSIAQGLWKHFGAFMEHKRVEGHGSLFQVEGKEELPPDFMEIFAVAESIIRQSGNGLHQKRFQRIVTTQQPREESTIEARKMAVALLLASAYAAAVRLHAHPADVRH